MPIVGWVSASWEPSSSNAAAAWLCGSSFKTDCLLALSDLPAVLGDPHAHSGLGIRKLGPKLFGCRGSLALRFVFQDRPAELFISFPGDHDEVKVFLRNGKYR